MSVRIDTTEIDRLALRLDAAGPEAEVRMEVALSAASAATESGARANALGFADTGELAGSIEVAEHRLVRKVYADPRQGAFLEFGSPNTGAPRPWMTGPARLAQAGLLGELGKIADPL